MVKSDRPEEAGKHLGKWAGDPRFMLSLARGLLTLETVVREGGRPISARQVAAATGLSIAAAQRCIYTLNALGYLRANRNGAVPAAKLAELMAIYAASSPLVWNCGPVLDALHEELDVTTSLALFQADGPLIVASRSSTAILQVKLPIGTAPPLHCTSSGKVYLASLAPEAMEGRLGTLGLDAYTSHTIIDEGLLRQEVAQVREQRFAVTDQELAVGVRTAAVPIQNARAEWVASLNASTMRGAVPARELRRRVIPALTRAAEQLSQLLV